MGTGRSGSPVAGETDISQRTGNDSQPAVGDSQPERNDFQPAAGDSQPAGSACQPDANDSQPDGSDLRRAASDSQPEGKDIRLAGDDAEPVRVLRDVVRLSAKGATNISLGRSPRNGVPAWDPGLKARSIAGHQKAFGPHRTGLQPLEIRGTNRFLGRCPRLILSGPSALKRRVVRPCLRAQERLDLIEQIVGLT